MARIKKIDKDEVKANEAEAEKKETKSSKKKKKEYSGSRWAALILLILTVILGMWFYIDGLGGWRGLGQAVSGAMPSFGWEKTYRFGENN